MLEQIASLILAAVSLCVAVERLLAAARATRAAGIAVKGVEEAVEIANQAASALSAAGENRWSIEYSKRAAEVKERARQRSMSEGVAKTLDKIVKRET